MKYHTHILPDHCLESGETLVRPPLAYRTWGQLNDAADNAVVVCHALTGNTDVDDWWEPLLGSGRVLDTDRYFVVCVNVPGSPYGSVSPVTPDPATGRPYGPLFPRLTVRDVVGLQRRLLEALGVRQVAFAVGGSMGGMQVLEWGFHAGFVRGLVPIAVGARHSAWCVAWSEAQRQALYADARWLGGWYRPEAPPEAGLAAARMTAMISYRTRDAFEARFGRAADAGAFDVERYLRYQGRKLVDRFDANCYVRLTQLMDTHDVGRERGGVPAALATLEQPTLVVSIDTDVLYPPTEQQELAALLPHATLANLTSPDGHDAFLIAFDQLAEHLASWIDAHPALAPSTLPSPTPCPEDAL